MSGEPETRVDGELSEVAITLDTRGSGGAGVREPCAEPHEVAVVRGDDPSTLPTTHDGGIDDEAIGDDLVGEIAPFASGERCAGTFGPAPGTYLFVCNMIEKEDGEHVVWVVATACS